MPTDFSSFLSSTRSSSHNGGVTPGLQHEKAGREAAPRDVYRGEADRPVAVSPIVGEGEMAQVIRDFDWSTTPLGPLENWSEPLLTTLNLALAASFPIAVYWGPEYITLYNDGYRPFLNSKHPRAIGRPAHSVWSESWHVVGPEFEAARLEGRTTHAEDVRIAIEDDGQLRDFYWRYSCGPVYANGSFGGIFNVVQNTTGAVLSTRKLRQNEARQAFQLKLLQKQREMADPDAILYAAAEALGRYLKADRVGFYEMPDEQTMTFTIGWTSGLLPPLTGSVPPSSIGLARASESGRSLVLGIDDVRLHPTTAGAKLEEIGVRAAIGLSILRHERWLCGLYVHQGEARPWREDELELAREVAEQTWDSVELARAQLALKKSEESLRLALTAANGIGTWDWDVAKDLVYANDNFARVFGIEPTQAMQGIPVAEFTRGIHAEDREAVEASIRNAVKTGEPFAEEYRLLGATGIVRWVSAKGRCFLDASGRAVRFPGVVVDVTERKLAEAALRQNEKLALTGRMTSVIAHEINNPLEALTNLLYLLRERLVTDEAALHYLDMSENELRRISGITQQTLRWTRESSKRAEWGTAGSLFDETLRLFSAKIRNRSVVARLEGGADVPVYGVLGQLRQVLANLVSNAVDATPANGLVTLEAESTAHGAVLRVRDTGAGMSPETQKKVMQPFFSTKGDLGNGLGLYISREIIEQHGGTIAIHSTVGEGTTVEVTLPSPGVPVNASA